MKNLYKILIIASLGFGINANAATFDFGTIANGNEYGAESITFTDGGVSVTATGWDGLGIHEGTPDYFAYLDSGNAGLGVCQNLNGDQCTPTSDDNVTYGETLRLTFDQEVNISKIDFVNGDHGTTFTGDFVLSIDGGVQNTYALTNIFAMGGLNGTVFDFYNPNTGGGSNVSNDQQFYINNLSSGARGLTPPEVPVPASVWLFGSGLIGLVGVARRKV